MEDILVLGAGIAVWVAWLWVSVGEWIIAQKSLECMGKNPDMSGYFLVLTILGIALTESAAIYWLIIAFQIMWLDPATIAPRKPIAAWIAVWFAWFGSWWGEGLLVAWALDATLRNPALKTKYMTYMILFVALVESAAIYWLVVAFQLLW